MLTADILQLIAIVVAINTLISSFFLWFLHKDKEILKKNVEKLSKHVSYTETLVDSLTEWLIAQEKKNKILEGCILKRMNSADGSQYFHNFQKIQKELIRNFTGRNKSLCCIAIICCVVNLHIRHLLMHMELLIAMIL